MISREAYEEFVKDASIEGGITVEEVVAKLTQERMYRRETFVTGRGGIRLLATMLEESGMFSASEDDQSSRAMLIRLLESMGLLDEGNIEKMLMWAMSNIDAVPDYATEIEQPDLYCATSENDLI